MADREELERQAQAKLVEARRLIREAGDLAKEGQFFLEFGEIGDFIPKSIFDRSLYRAEAEAILVRDGRDNGYDKVRNEEMTKKRGYDVYDYVDRPRTPHSELEEDEREAEIEKVIDDIIEGLNIPWEFREYNTEGVDRWWHPSRC